MYLERIFQVLHDDDDDDAGVEQGGRPSTNGPFEDSVLLLFMVVL